MQSIHGNFNMFRVKTVDGKDAIMLCPIGEFPLSYSSCDEEDGVDVSFEPVQGGDHNPDSYLTLLYPNDFKLHLGPYTPTIKTV